MEIRRDFAKTGKSYLVGLAVTDDPASLGTDMLEFSRRHENVEFSAPLEVCFDFEPVADPETSFSARIKAMFSRKQATDDVRFGEMEGAVMTVAEQLQEADTRFTEKFAALSEQVADLKQQVKPAAMRSARCNPSFPPRKISASRRARMPLAATARKTC